MGGVKRKPNPKTSWPWKFKRCKHNLNYWRLGDYLGIGAGALGKISDAQSIMRLWKLKQPKAYLVHAGTLEGVGGKQRCLFLPEDGDLLISEQSVSTQA